MQEFYLTIEQVGDTLYERYIDSSGKERSREVKYEPNLFMHGQQGQASKYEDIYGKGCVKKSFPNMRDANNWIRRMEDMGLEAMGMDDFKLAYLSDTYPNEIHYDDRLIRAANCDIEVTAPEFPDPSQALYPIDAITHYDSIDDRFYVFDLLNSPYGSVTHWDPVLAGKSEAEGGDAVPQRILDRIVYIPCENEEELLLQYLNLWTEKTPVIFTGWNTESFDIPYIYNRIKNVFGEKTANRLSPHRRTKSKIIQNMYGEREVIQIYGISHLDYIELYKKFSFTNQPSYSLDYVAEYELGEGKLPYDGPINKLRETNHQRYISYNIIDVERVQRIDQKRQFINLSLSMGYYAKMQIQSVFSPIKTWDAIIFNSLKSKKKVIPQCRSHVKQSYPGAYVKEPVPNSYKYVMSCDLTSLYPSIIRQVNISPETLAGQFQLHPIHDYINKVAPRPSDEYSCSPNGWMYDKSYQGVIPEEITKVFYQRKEHKGYMLGAQRNMELIKEALHHDTFGSGGVPDVDVRNDFDDETKALLSTMSKEALKQFLDKCDRASIAGNTAQINRKLLINSLYGALGNVWFRYYDLRNASAITLFGQMAIQWIERKINEYMNKVVGLEDHKFVIAGDTDSVYICVDKLIDKVGEDKFRDTNHLVDFLDKFGKEKLEPAIDSGFREMCEYMNNREHLMFMDREAISGPPLGSKGLGGFWTAKKRYALNVWDMEGTRYAEPKLKIMGLETQKSSTPKACQKALKECIRRMLQEGEESLQTYFKEFEHEFKQQDYKTIAAVSSANNIMKYDVGGYPGPKCPYHIRGILTYNRATKGMPNVTAITEGEKVMVLPLREQNPFGDTCISWPSGSEITPEIRSEVLKWIDYPALFNKTFVKPLTSFTEAAKIDYEKKASLFDMFDF
ncbi:DNA polymerase [Serratia phage X20]|uniref:DNA-directed DNA polymerase n=3 Tax=Winklervirus TaxID=2560256 RepID=A0A1Z1LYW9_9CAUD|nr:DNA polymerase [Serratia phage CHI14]YP_010092197.1 DNA polymerase [Serratia phage X20]ARW57470.1 DNA polymerase [Serratia phage CHI14]ARW57745.1 DNA polymerase [Serratia phage CBH8]ARW58019.1 DNA polymerase [Serratia phage X20]